MINIEEHNKRVQLQAKLDKIEEEDNGGRMLGWAMLFVVGVMVIALFTVIPITLDALYSVIKQGQ